MTDLESQPIQADIYYYFWLKHDVLPIFQICFLAKGIEPNPLKEMCYKLGLAFQNCSVYSLLQNGLRNKDIKSYSNGNASPIECFLYLQKKHI